MNGPGERGENIEILELIDRLEALASTGRRVPMAKRTLIDPERLLELVDQMRVAVPRDVQEAQDILHKREEVINQALREAKRIKTAVETESRSRLEENEVMKEARRKSEEVVEEAQRRAQRILDQADAQAHASRTGADDYSQEALYKLEQEIAGVLSTVRRGIEVLDTGRQPALERV